MSLLNYVEYHQNGIINIDGTVKKFEQDLEHFLIQYNKETTEIASVVKAVFAEHKGNISLGALCSFAIPKLPGFDPARYEETSERIRGYIRNNPRLFLIKKGKNGGVCQVEQPN